MKDRFGRRKMVPVTGLRALRLFAWLYAWLAGGLAVTLVFLPAHMAALDPDRPFGTALRAWFDTNAFVAVLPGVFTWLLFLGPVWLVLRLWIARQGDRAIGPRPAVFPVWMAIWVIFMLLELQLADVDAVRPPPGPFALIPAPFDLLFEGLLMVKMAGVTVMFAVYRKMRPRDAIEIGVAGPVISRR